MIGRDPDLCVDEADDDFHPPTSDNPSWIETMWFPFWIPEEGMTVYVRVWFSPNAGQQGGAVSGWRAPSVGLFGEQWVEDYAGPPDLLDLRLEKGLRIHCLRPLHRYEIEYRGDRVELDIRFDATMAPNPVPPEESPGMFSGHFEQPGHVRGELRYAGRTYAVDCHSIRDRSWGPREMPSNLRIGNAHGSADRFGFFAYINPDSDGHERITSGYLSRDGIEARLVTGLRETEWHDDVPTAIRLSATDAVGRQLVATGECVNAMSRNAGHGVYAVLNLVRWRHQGGIAWGENHDIWSERDWLAAGRPRL
jgi:hypothetical protein